MKFQVIDKLRMRLVIYNVKEVHNLWFLLLGVDKAQLSVQIRSFRVLNSPPQSL